MASLAPFLTLVATALVGSQPFHPYWLAAFGGSAALLFAGALVTPRSKRWGRSLSTLGLVGAFLCLGFYLRRSQALSLLGVLGLVGSVGGVWGLGGIETFRLSRRRARELAEKRARLASWFFVVEWLLFLPWEREGIRGGLAAAGGLAVAVAYTSVWVAGARRRGDPKWKWPLIAALLAGAGAAASARSPVSLLSWGAIVPAVVLFLPSSSLESRALRRTWWQPVAEHPARLLVVTFVALSSIGTLLLLLPFCSSTGESIGLLNAAFTAVSAVCVTGLIVLDTPGAFSFFGESMLLLLIQLGGLGIMSFSSVTLTLLGVKPSLRHEAAVAGLLGAEDRGALRLALGKIVSFTFGIELVGAMLLTAAFIEAGEPVGDAVWRGVFTAVSAFCNAGFALQSDSLIGYQQNPWVLHVVGALIIVGGLSPATVAALAARARNKRVAVEQKIALLATAVLLVGGAGMILALEWSNSLGELSTADRVTNAWFQSLTTRTAGFNSIDLTLVRPATLTLIILLMFVGGSPGGTAGGVKTTTVVVLLLAVVSAVRGRWYASAFRRKLSHRTVYKAASIVTLGVLSGCFGLFALQLTQAMDTGVALFEAVSALGTVGLSLGGTGLLDEVGKLVVMACMFAGRVGPLSLFLFLQGQFTSSPWELIEEEVAVG